MDRSHVVQEMDKQSCVAIAMLSTKVKFLTTHKTIAFEDGFYSTEIINVYIYIYMYTHTHTHTQYTLRLLCHF